MGGKQHRARSFTGSLGLVSFPPSFFFLFHSMAEDSFSLADELLHQQDDPYVMEHEIALDDLDQAERASTLDTAIDSIASSFDAVSNSETFDALRSFLKYYTSLTSQSQHKLLDAVSSGLAATLDATAREEHSDDSSAFPALAPTLERYAFLLQWFVSVAEKHNGAGREGAVGATPAAPAKGRRGAKSTGSKSTGGKDSWEWSAAIPGVLALMSKALRVRSERMWTVSAARDSFVGGCIMRPSLILLENEAYLKVPAIKFGIFKIVCQAVKAHGQAFNAQMSVIQSLQYYEHLAEPCAELLALMRIEFDYERLGEDVLREVAAKNFGALDTKSPRSFGRFLVRIAELSPRSVLKQISLLQKHLDSEVSARRKFLP